MSEHMKKLLVASKKMANIVEIVGHCVGTWTPGHQALAQEYAAEGREAIFEAEEAEAAIAAAQPSSTSVTPRKSGVNR